MACEGTYWRQCSANTRLIEGVKFFCPGDRPVNVGFHGDGGRDGVNVNGPMDNQYWGCAV